ncbi:alkyl sulfatase dimerization domain-containing protein [Anaeromyxobacter sp. Red801]|uniref:alkyl sulfatase dimerization domain-containing protein n=1 Tax=Anaeromyxobacter sp. Red801 TaxID=3411632 RepID=UPI003BA2A56A
MITRPRAAVLLAIAATVSVPALAATNPYYLEPGWMSDPLFTGREKYCPPYPDVLQCPGAWWRDTANQNLLSQHTVDEFDRRIDLVYATPPVPGETPCWTDPAGNEHFCSGFEVYVWRGGSPSNVVLVTTRYAYLIVGCGGGDGAAGDVRTEMFRFFSTHPTRLSSRRLAGVVLPAALPQYDWGCSTWTAGTANVGVYAAASYASELERERLLVDELTRRRRYAYGAGPTWGADGKIGAGSARNAAWMPPEAAAEPTAFISTATPILLQPPAVTVQLIPTGRGHADLLTYIPAASLLVAGDMGTYLPDAGTIAEQPVSVTAWIDALEELRLLAPDVLVPMQGGPTVGAEAVLARFVAQKAALVHVRDRTLELANAGTPLEEIVAAITLPEELAGRPELEEFAGTIPFLVRSVFHERLGWFGGAPVELTTTLTELHQAQILVGLAGNMDTLLTRARKAELAAQTLAQAEEALFLASAAYRYARDVNTSYLTDATAVYAQALRKVAYMQNSAHVRNYHLCKALQIEGHMY